jgi:CRISPR-associated protein Cas5d
MIYDTPKNAIEFKVYGKYALFTDPITKLGGEKCSYQIPTYEAVKGICKSIYWKPTFVWVIDKVRVVKQIEMETKGIRTLKYDGKGNGLHYYTYLKDVEYQVGAHFEWNVYDDEYENDQIDGKHFAIANRSLEKGGRQDIFLGTRECQGYVETCNFGDGKGNYDDINELHFGVMFHSFGYPNELLKVQQDVKKITANLWDAKMEKGIIDFVKPKNNLIKKEIKKIASYKYEIGVNLLGVEKEYENIFGKGGEIL